MFTKQKNENHHNFCPNHRVRARKRLQTFYDPYQGMLTQWPVLVSFLNAVILSSSLSSIRLLCSERRSKVIENSIGPTNESPVRLSIERYTAALLKLITQIYVTIVHCCSLGSPTTWRRTCTPSARPVRSTFTIRCAFLRSLSVINDHLSFGVEFIEK